MVETFETMYAKKTSAQPTSSITFALLFALNAMACGPGVYNAGDPASDEWLETRVLACLLAPECPVPNTPSVPVPTLARGSNGASVALLLIDGRVRTWGLNGSGQLGHDNTTNIGDGTGPSIISAGDVAVGGTPSALNMGGDHMCALFPAGTVRCWGNGANGRLGYDSSASIGDGVGSTIIAAGDVPVGGTVTAIRPGSQQTCALLTTGAVRCWGNGVNGRLGYNATTPVGNGGTSIIAAGDLSLGGIATGLGVGGGTGCAILSTGNLRCWGSNANGQLGYGNTTDVGDGTGPTIIAAGDVPVGGTVTQLALGPAHVCALLSGGTVRCWGNGADGRLGYNSTANVGDGVGVSIVTAGDVPVGGTVTQIAAGASHTCALLATGAVRCWGNGANGRLGHNSTANIGDGTGPTIIAAGDIPLGGTAAQVVALNGVTCAVLTNAAVRCWGLGSVGSLGNNSTANVGDGVGLSIIDAGDIPYE